MKRTISTLLIIMGLSMLMYPKTMEKYHMYKQEKLIKDWESSLALIDQGYDHMGEEISGIEYVDNEDKMDEDHIDEEERARELENQARDEYIKDNMDGMLKIDKIDLNLPVLRNATEKNMQISVASMKGTGKMGAMGNYAIAGHRNYTYGRNFNRLDEVEIGDSIKLNNGKEEFQYKVYNKLYVYPNETWVLDEHKDRNEITLITCHPMGKPTHRLIIKADLIK